MTMVSGKPKQDDEPATVDSGKLESDQGGKDTKMLTSRGNGADDPSPLPAVGEDIQKHLGRKLKAAYDELVRQPVPDTFRQLLDELDRREKKQ